MTWDPSNPLLGAVLEAAMAFHVAGDPSMRADAPGFGSERPEERTARMLAGGLLRRAADAWGAEERRRGGGIRVIVSDAIPSDEIVIRSGDEAIRVKVAK